MADPIPPSNPTPDLTPTPSPDSGVNQAAASLKKAETIFALALQPEHLPK